jgi:hypothetical protein
MVPRLFNGARTFFLTNGAGKTGSSIQKDKVKFKSYSNTKLTKNYQQPKDKSYSYKTLKRKRRRKSS